MSLRCVARRSPLNSERSTPPKSLELSGLLRCLILEERKSTVALQAVAQSPRTSIPSQKRTETILPPNPKQALPFPPTLPRQPPTSHTPLCTANLLVDLVEIPSTYQSTNPPHPLACTDARHRPCLTHSAIVHIHNPSAVDPSHDLKRSPHPPAATHNATRGLVDGARGWTPTSRPNPDQQSGVGYARRFERWVRLGNFRDEKEDTKDGGVLAQGVRLCWKL